MTERRIGGEITPEMKLAALLESYPELEEVLMGMSPAFSKLKNPVLRRTIAKVATLEQVARVGRVPVGELIGKLRQAAGLDAAALLESGVERDEHAPPRWVKAAEPAKTLDAREMLERGEHPVEIVLSDLRKMGSESEKVYVLIAPFLPAPLIDRARKLGYDAWWEEAPGMVKTYFARPGRTV